MLRQRLVHQIVRNAALVLALAPGFSVIALRATQLPDAPVQLAAGPRFLARDVNATAAGAPKYRDASRAAVFRRRIALDLQAVPLGRALGMIARKATLRLTYSAAVVDLSRRVTLAASDLTVGAALSAVLYDAGVDVLLGEYGQAALVKRGALLPLPGSVSGRVTDGRTGQGLAGTEVLLQGTQSRTVTDQDGGYRLTDVAAGSYVLLVRRIGYAPEHRQVVVTASQETTVDVALQLASTRLQDLVVSAEKREERLQDVPIPVTVIPADQLVTNKQVRLEDYYTRIPGVNLAADSYRNSGGKMVIRGIVGGGNPTVGIVVDDVPYGSSTGLFGAGGYVPDIDPSELARIEVLRGPQGTLYGASSIGGLLNYATVDPTTERRSGRLLVGSSGVQNGDQLGYDAHGALNVPLSRSWAIRASAFIRRDAGYIDNVQSGENGVNRNDVAGGRLSTLWTPSPNTSLKLSALIQGSDRNGAARIEPGVGDLRQTGLPKTGKFEGDANVFAATWKQRLGRAELTAISGYSINRFTGVFDLTNLYGFATNAVFGDPSTVTNEYSRTKKFTQEVRVSLPLGEAFEWRVGGFYTRENSRFSQSPSAADPITGAVTNLGILSAPITTFVEYAAFTDLTWQISDRLDLQIGGRESRNKQTYENTLTGPFVTAFFGVPSPLVNPTAETKDNSFTYLVTPRFRISPDLMTYARLASGYRTGGPNFLADFFGAPIAFGPDKTRNYEIGAKGTVLNRALSFEIAAYYIDWKDVQVSAFNGRTSYLTNAGSARSQGLELSLESSPLAGLTLGSAVGWNDAKLTEDLPANSSLVAVAGDRLQGRRFTSNASVEQAFPLGSSVTASIGGAVSHVSSLAGEFPGSPTVSRRSTPGYTQTDVRTTARYGSWGITLFANNLTNERGILNDWSFYPPNTAFYDIQPRTIGMSVATTF
jgi:iron complex outermembrane receptor protein